MTRVILGATMSIDGYINDRSGSDGALYTDFATFLESKTLLETIRTTGAVVMGRNSFAMVEDPDTYADSYEFQVPIFVLTHVLPEKKPKENDRLTFTFVTDGIQSAIAQARAAASKAGPDKVVTVIGGATTTRQCLQAGLVDELHVDVMPVLLGGGLRWFDDSGLETIQLERLKVVELPGGRTHLEFRVVR